MWSVFLSKFAWIPLCLIWKCSDCWCLSRFTIRLEKNSVSLCQMRPSHAWMKHLCIMGIFSCCFLLSSMCSPLSAVSGIMDRLLDCEEIFLWTVGGDQLLKTPDNTTDLVLFWFCTALKYKDTYEEQPWWRLILTSRVLTKVAHDQTWKRFWLFQTVI